MNNFFANKAWLASAPKSIRQWAVEEAVAANPYWYEDRLYRPNVRSSASPSKYKKTTI
jgi:hypothetical protein